MTAIVTVEPCSTYELDAVRQAITACLAPLGGMPNFVKPGMHVLLKPNMLAASEREQGISTHPAVVRVVAEMAQAAGGEVLIGDSPAGAVSANQAVYRRNGMLAAAEESGAALVQFDSVVWKRSHGQDYLIARPVTDADLVINLPKLKTHSLMLYTGAIKNMFGVIPGTRKTEVHVRAPGMQDFSRELVNLFELVHPGLTIMDGIMGQDGAGPGAGGTPHAYGCVSASTDSVALDAIMTQAMGFRSSDMLFLTQAAENGLGIGDPAKIQLLGTPSALHFGQLNLPRAHWYLRLPAWVSVPVQGQLRLRPELNRAICSGCGKCVQICPGKAIQPGKPATFKDETCIGCMCCAEVCPEGAIGSKRGLFARMLGIGM